MQVKGFRLTSSYFNANKGALFKKEHKSFGGRNYAFCGHIRRL